MSAATKQANKTAYSVAETLRQRALDRASNPGRIWGMPWAWPGLNKLTGGIHQTEMTVLAARPGAGKTTVLVQQADALADYLDSEEGLEKHYGEVIKLALLESSAEVFQQRWASARSQVSKRRIMEGTASPEALERYLSALAEIEQMPIEYADGDSIHSLDDLVKFLVRGNKAAWFGLDYLQKVPHGNGDYQAITQISGRLMEVARDYAPGMVLSQLTREVDKRDDRRPVQSDLRGSGQIEADARVIVGLYRERIYQIVPEDERNKPHNAEIIVIKNNELGGGGVVDLLFHPRQGYFEDISDIMEDDGD